MQSAPLQPVCCALRTRIFNLWILDMFREAVPAQPESGPIPRNLLNPHAIAITVKAVARLDGVPVRSENEFAACECADQNQQRRLR